MSYAARLPSLDEAQPEVLALWRRNRAAELPHDALFRWYYRTTPSPPAQCVLVGRAGEERPVGMIGIGMRPLGLERASLRAALLGDLVVDKAHRSLFPVLTLLRAATGWARDNFALQYGFPNPLAQPVFKRLGFHAVAPLQRYVFVLRHAPYLRDRITRDARWDRLGPARVVVESRAVARLAALPFDGWRRLIHPGYDRPLGAWLRRITGAAPEIDELIARCDYAPALRGLRSAAFLRWRFLERPDQRCELLGMYEGGALLGYAAVHRAGSIAHLRDLCAGTLDELSRLLGALAAHLRAAGHDAISFLCHAPTRVTERLLDFGFQPRGDGHPLITLPGAAWPDGDARFGDPDHWLVTEADEDQ